MRQIPLLLGLLATGLLAAAGYLYVTDRPQPPAPPFAVSPTAFDLTVPPGEHEVVLHVTNPADRSRRIVGLAEVCGLNCCFRAKHREVVTVGAGETFEYRVKMIVYHPGRFESAMDIFLEDGGIRKVEISMKGVCVESGNVK